MTSGESADGIRRAGGDGCTMKTDMQARSLIGFGSGESLQLGFTGQGWVLIQPSEGRPVAVSAG